MIAHRSTAQLLLKLFARSATGATRECDDPELLITMSDTLRDFKSPRFKWASILEFHK
jgi:hypothetical protein